jgi:hypothetical protein
MATDDRAVALSTQLAQIHDSLRRQLADARADRGSLLVHCFVFCDALASHHQAEDSGMLARLLRVRPELSTVIAKLTEDHEMIAKMLARVKELRDPDAVRRELDGLAAIVESHFRFEERAIGEALDSMGPDASPVKAFDVPR